MTENNITTDHRATDPFASHRHSHTCWWNHETGRWVCSHERFRPDPVGTDQPLVDTRDMLVVHTAMLREFRLAPDAVTRTSSGHRRQAGRVARHIDFICELLHHHHAGEDELLWPKLRERTPRATHRVIDDVESQHHQIDAGLHAVSAATSTWATEPSAAHRDHLAASLTSLHALLADHLDLEERALLPLAAATFRDDEWHALGEAAVASLPKSLLPLVFGMFAYEGDDAVLRDMLSSAPAVPRAVLPHIAPRVYARRARRIHGTSRP
ncbi:hemerythrin domain-containing protein [Williamsia sterculiae]|uniref:Hemerythrin-like domain-containing protein n=1 Tax=Williamsia sterculiae TaxID=1344003 RepID=A0A1N7GY17_9NOCA|nr:hemerythrin domain-containing protein [Williamsia sterculiae]SIS17461.1 Hemerythrin-like domain-containing protein [Williamsia sterculiae]